MAHPKRAQWTLLAVVLTLSASMLACALFSSSSSSSKTGPITDAVTSKDVEGDNFDPVDITDSFPPDQKTLHAVVTLTDAPTDTVVKAVWKVVDVGDTAQNGKTIDSSEVTTDGSRNVDFTLKPDNPLPAGSYQVVIYQDGKKDRTLDFTVEGQVQAAKPTPAPVVAATPVPPTSVPPTAVPVNNAGYITAAVMAQDATGVNFDPVGVTNTFSGNQPMHAVVTIVSAPDGTAFKANWKVVDIGSAGTPGESMGDYSITAGGSRNMDFSFKPTTQLPPGQYQVELYVNGALTRTLPFTVQPPAAQPTSPPQLSGYILDVTLAQNVQGANLDPSGATTVFGPADTIHAVVSTANAPKGTQFKADWYVVDIGDASQANKLIISSQLTADGTRNLDFKLTPTSQWPVGTYRVEISVNGQVESTAMYSVK
jgi:hypothetical protein